ncbi:MAG: hypothetical protein ACREFY_01035 [Acetobacteraceae bacterium]
MGKGDKELALHQWMVPIPTAASIDEGYAANRFVARPHTRSGCAPRCIARNHTRTATGNSGPPRAVATSDCGHRRRFGRGISRCIVADPKLRDAA